MKINAWLVVVAGLLLLPACRQGSPGNAESITGVGESGARRLSRNEYDSTLRDVLFDETRSAFAHLPEDVNDPFDNDYLTQEASAVLVEAAETLATEAAARLVADPVKRDQVVG